MSQRLERRQHLEQGSSADSTGDERDGLRTVGPGAHGEEKRRVEHFVAVMTWGSMIFGLIHNLNPGKTIEFYGIWRQNGGRGLIVSIFD